MKVTWFDLIMHGQDTSRKKQKLKKNDFFRDFETPKNDDIPFRREAFFRYLLMEVGCFEPVKMPLRGNYEFIIDELRQWTRTRIHYWQRMYDILCAEYEPLWNYNRFDEEAQNTKEDDVKHDEATQVTSDVMDSNEKVAGYNSGDLVENESVDSNEDVNTNTKEDFTDEFERNYTRNAHAYGNIGVMSSQDLVKQEMEVAQISMYQIIIDEFKDTFCQLVY